MASRLVRERSGRNHRRDFGIGGGDGNQVVVQCGQLGIGRVVVDDQDHLHTLVIGLRFEMLADEDQSFDGLRVGASHAGGAVAQFLAGVKCRIDGE